MANRWDPPPFPKKGDRSNKPLFEAIGRALVWWEEMEAALSNLYAALAEKDQYDRSAQYEYGRDLNFSGRLRNLRRIAEQYFVRHPSQDHEGEFFDLARDIEGWSLRRNDVAHGLLRPMEVVRSQSDRLLEPIDRIEWYLVPPEHRETKHIDQNTPAIILSSGGILSFAGHFQSLVQRTVALVGKVELPDYASRRTRDGRPRPQWREASPKRTRGARDHRQQPWRHLRLPSHEVHRRQAKRSPARALDDPASIEDS